MKKIILLLSVFITTLSFGQIGNISNDEQGSSVRGKLNQTIDSVNKARDTLFTNSVILPTQTNPSGNEAINRDYADANYNSSSDSTFSVVTALDTIKNGILKIYDEDSLTSYIKNASDDVDASIYIESKLNSEVSLSYASFAASGNTNITAYDVDNLNQIEMDGSMVLRNINTNTSNRVYTEYSNENSPAEPIYIISVGNPTGTNTQYSFYNNSNIITNSGDTVAYRSNIMKDSILISYSDTLILDADTLRGDSIIIKFKGISINGGDVLTSTDTISFDEVWRDFEADTINTSFTWIITTNDSTWVERPKGTFSARIE